MEGEREGGREEAKFLTVDDTSEGHARRRFV